MTQFKSRVYTQFNWINQESAAIVRLSENVKNMDAITWENVSQTLSIQQMKYENIATFLNLKFTPATNLKRSI